MVPIEYRVENKYLVTDADLAVLAGRLKSVMAQDIHQTGACYSIRSLYFDDAWDRCMDENEAGVDQRQKYRIRIYDPNARTIHLEIKEKQNGMTRKSACDLSRQECEWILNGSLPLTFDSRKPFVQLQMEMRCSQLKPKILIEYERTAFVHPTGNVRVTFDRNIMASRYLDDFFAERVSGMTPVLPTGVHVLEVKYDEFLPEFIAKKLEIGTLRQTAFSKYYLGRLAVQGEFLTEL